MHSVRHLLALVLTAASAVLAAQTAQPPDRTRFPVPGPPPDVRLPAVQKHALSNGLRVWIVEHHEVPVVQATLVVVSGSADDPPGSYGIASLTAAMLTEGAGNRTALEIADEIDFLGASLDASAGIDSSAVRLHVPVARLADALPIMADVALRPTFPGEELERLRKARLTSLLQARDSPATVASLAFSRTLYGRDHRYGTPTMGTAATIEGFTADALRAFYTAVFRPDNAAIIVVGDVEAGTVLPLLETSFGSWMASGPPPAPPSLPPVERPSARTVFLVDKPGAPQSEIRIGWIGVPRSTPDYFPLLVMNTVLGGAFSSRLNLNLRERNGYTYGASSSFDMREAAGPFTAGAAVQTDKTAAALTEFFNELNGMLKPVPDEELERAKNYVALRFPAGFETSGDISRRLEEALVYGLPDDYFSRYVESIRAVTSADVLRVARQHLDPDRFVVVVVGDRARIEPDVKRLNLGPIRILTVDELFE